MDVWFVRQLAQFLGKFPRFDLLLQSAIVHNLLGGFWYGAALFFFWARSNRTEHDATRRRILTTLIGTVIAILLMLLAEKLLSWPPPMRLPALAHLYPKYIYLDPGSNSFPSQSTTLYAAVTAGIYSLNKRAGWLLWFGVVFVVALPRMYLGGHYPTDVMVGIVIGLAGYMVARRLFEPKVVSYADRQLSRGGWREGLINLAVFAWILLVATEFRDLEWLGKLTASLVK